MAYRIGIAAFLQESNSFSPRWTERQDFSTYSGEEIRSHFDNTNSEVTGFLDSCAEFGWEPILLMTAMANSGGALSADCFDHLSSRLLSQIKAHKLDALLISLHGAMSTEHYPSGDAEIARRVRVAIGPDIALVVTLDFHANITPLLLQHIDGVTGYRTYPHSDQRETGRRAGEMLARVLSGEASIHWNLRLPLLLSAEASATFEEPMLGVMQELEAEFRSQDGLYATLFCVQPWLDLAFVGGSLLVTQFGSQQNLSSIMKAIAKRLWDARGSFRVDWVQPKELIDRIAQARSRPVLVSEAYDAPPAGASGDHTGLISILLPERERLKSCAFIVDPEFVLRAQQTGKGATVEGEIGARLDSRFSCPIRLRGKVEGLSDGTFSAKASSAHGRQFSMGPAAVLAIDKMRIVVGSKAVLSTVDPELYRSQGVEPSEQDVVGVKSALQFRYCYEDISRSVVNLDMRGTARGKLQSIPFTNISRPIFPLDDFAWTPPEPERILPAYRRSSTV